MTCTYILILSSENYDQDVELFLPRKPLASGHSVVDSDGTSDRFLRRPSKAVRFHVNFIKLLTFVACFLWP